RFGHASLCSGLRRRKDIARVFLRPSDRLANEAATSGREGVWRPLDRTSQSYAFGAYGVSPLRQKSFKMREAASIAAELGRAPQTLRKTRLTSEPCGSATMRRRTAPFRGRRGRETGARRCRRRRRERRSPAPWSRRAAAPRRP